MKSIAQNLMYWWRQLEARQQRTLRFAVPIIIVLLLYLLLHPLLDRYRHSKLSYQKLNMSYQWLAEQQTLETIAPSSCQNLFLLSDSTEFQQILNQQLGDKQILNPVWHQATDGWLLTLQEIDANQFLVWLEQATCQGLVLKAIDLEKQSSSKLNASVELVVL